MKLAANQLHYSHGDTHHMTDAYDENRHTPCPGWLEIGVSLAVLVLVGYGGALLIARLPVDDIAISLMLAAWSGIAGLAAFGAAFCARLRLWDAFGVRKTTLRWLLIGAAAGVVAFLLKGFVVVAYVAVFGPDGNPQDIYAIGAQDSVASFVLATLFIGVLTPIGEEFLFRGVVTSALLRYGPFVGVVGGAIIFALAHGLNVIFPVALVGGVIAGEVFRRSRSIWPAIVTHIVINLPTVPIMALVAASPQP